MERNCSLWDKDMMLHLDLLPVSTAELKRIKLETNNRNMMPGKSLNVWKLNSTLLNNTWVKEDDTTEVRLHFEMSKNENHVKICRMQPK